MHKIHFTELKTRINDGAVGGRWTSDLKCGNESTFLSGGGGEFPETGLNALLPLVVRREEGTDRWVEEEDLRERKHGGVQRWSKSQKNG